MTAPSLRARFRTGRSAQKSYDNRGHLPRRQRGKTPEKPTTSDRPKHRRQLGPAQLKCLQDWFERYGDDLYGELKHIRNALDQVLASARFAARVRDDARQLDVLVATHRLLRAQHAARVVPNDPSQLHLF